jgi:type III secretion protein U
MGEKTEQPTSKKLEDARKQGQVAKSPDFTQTVLICSLFGYIVFAGTNIAKTLGALFVLPTQFIHQPFATALANIFPQLMTSAIELLMPFLLIVIVMAIAAEALQVGFYLAFEAAKPSMKKLNIIENAKNVFSKKNLIDFLKNCLKVTFLTVLIWILVRDAIGPLTTVPLGGIEAVGMATVALIERMLIFITIAYVVISGADFAWQRYHHIQELKMSKEEIMQEYKQMEGDPHIKSKRKHLAQEIAMGGQEHATKKANVVVTNPTHIAVAIRYDEEETPLPLIVAKGEGAMAERIVAAARAAGVPIMQNIPLARELHERGHLEQYIPSELIDAVAAVLIEVEALRSGDHGGRS